VNTTRRLGDIDMVPFIEQQIYQDVYATLSPVAPVEGGNRKLFAVQAPAVEVSPWLAPPYIVYRLQTDAADRGYQTDVVIQTVLAVNIVALTTDDIAMYGTAVYTALNGRQVVDVTPQFHRIRYQWLATQPLFGAAPFLSVQLYRVLVSVSVL